MFLRIQNAQSYCWEIADLSVNSCVHMRRCLLYVLSMGIPVRPLDPKFSLSIHFHVSCSLTSISILMSLHSVKLSMVKVTLLVSLSKPSTSCTFPNFHFLVLVSTLKNTHKALSFSVLCFLYLVCHHVACPPTALQNYGPFLSALFTKSFAHDVFISHLDYCNLLAGLPLNPSLLFRILPPKPFASLLTPIRCKFPLTYIDFVPALSSFTNSFSLPSKPCYSDLSSFIPIHP